jgi:peptidoglycan/xylan/chitin deacetylase (PgdA/CDA1 family)
MLRVFEASGLHATWAAVGLLFFGGAAEAQAHLPALRPAYRRPELSPYAYLASRAGAAPALHFAPEVIDRIARAPGQEVGTHTFSHYYCLEAGQALEHFEADLRAAAEAAARRGLKVASLVFPRNQWNAAYLPALPAHGVTAFRGTERSWVHAASADAGHGLLRRGLRLADAYLNLTGHHTWPPPAPGAALPLDLPASRFLRPYSRRLAPLDGLRLRRITRSMDHAARRGEVFHLWWHPCNFGRDTAENLRFLERIAAHYRGLRERHGMASLNMGELAALAAAGA